MRAPQATFGYGNVLGMHAFGLAENGSYGLAEEKADVALTMESNDIWAVHAMAHVYEMEVPPRCTCAFSHSVGAIRERWKDTALLARSARHRVRLNASCTRTFFFRKVAPPPPFTRPDQRYSYDTLLVRPPPRPPLFLQARASEGCSFLTDCRDQWEDKEGPLQQHMGWHLGLFSLERGQEARATRVFDTILAPPRVRSA